ncbi:Uncharacterised protein [Klebsiella pneumoniae subsp. ozaenae]|uniref:Uncharacterized protein n=1 Tax=Klebsiella pneumoniae subsp. ozaenae TaxID=574 RepID=A0A378AA80_KLEPO|nr:Uncharacterised protein [Klebsiella pneumoniae subsp. ozaenae]
MGFKIGAHRLDELDHILRDGPRALHFNAGDRVIQAQHGGMQRLASNLRSAVMNSSDAPLRRTRPAAIDLVTHQRMGDMRHMHADLMCTTGFQTQTQAGMDAEMFHNSVVVTAGLPIGCTAIWVRLVG